jgi:hypothetical protein
MHTRSIAKRTSSVRGTAHKECAIWSYTIF